MSGHNKWSKIKHKKGKTDQARSSMFTKAGRLITVAAREGGGDPEMNFSLRLAIQKAKSVNMPKDNIERAIKSGTGELKDGSVIEEIIYEGFGPHGIAFLIESVTDNKNRSVGEIKHALTRHGGSLGGPGSVQWQFERKGIIRFTSEKKSQINDWDDFQLSLMDAGAEDIIDEEEGVEIVSSVENFQETLKVFEQSGVEPDDSGLEWTAKDTVSLDDSASEKVSNVYDTLDELDDVRAVYTNEK